ncbi:MAG: tetratricopeptide repeat protein [Phycisphaerae bacterium]|jgi:tetratricopeptide (TPR) repeat protein
MAGIRKIKITIIALSLVVLTGCQGSHLQKKQEMQSKWQKSSSEIRLSAAEAQIESGQYAQAEAAVRKSLDMGLNLPQANLLMGKIELARSNFEQAKRYLQNYVRLDEKDDNGWFLLGLSCERLGDDLSAMKWYKKAFEISPNNTDYILAVGRIYMADGNFEQAESFYLEKMASNPADTELKVAAAQMYLAQDKKDRALQLYEQASMLRPQSGDLLEALGSCYIMTKQWDKAFNVQHKLYSRCVLREEKTRYLKTMAITAMNAGNYSNAVKYYSSLTSQDRNNAGLWLSTGQAALGAGLLRQAITCSQKVLELSPETKEAWLLSGSANYKNGNFLQAAADFQKAADVSQYANFAWLMTGRCYEKLGRAQQAQTAYKKAEQFEADSELGQLLASANGKG